MDGESRGDAQEAKIANCFAYLTDVNTIGVCPEPVHIFILKSKKNRAKKKNRT